MKKKARLRQCSGADAEEKRLEQRNTGLFIVFYSGATPKTIVKYPSIYTRILCTYFYNVIYNTRKTYIIICVYRARRRRLTYRISYVLQVHAVWDL